MSRTMILERDRAIQTRLEGNFGGQVPWKGYLGDEP